MMGVLTVWLASIAVASATMLSFGDYDVSGNPMTGVAPIAQVQGTNDDAGVMSGLVGSTLLQVYKFDVGGTGSTNSLFAASGGPSGLTLTPTDPFDPAIDWSGFYAVNKSNGSFEYYSLAGWDGAMPLFFGLYDQENPPPTIAGISHVSIYGGAVPTTTSTVPDGGASVALFGLGLIGLGWFRKQK